MLAVRPHGAIMVAAQRIHVGMAHARKTVTVTANGYSFRLVLTASTSHDRVRSASSFRNFGMRPTPKS